jgi:hypothetical protein
MPPKDLQPHPSLGRFNNHLRARHDDPTRLPHLNPIDSLFYHPTLLLLGPICQRPSGKLDRYRVLLPRLKQSGLREPFERLGRAFHWRGGRTGDVDLDDLSSLMASGVRNIDVNSHLGGVRIDGTFHSDVGVVKSGVRQAVAKCYSSPTRGNPDQHYGIRTHILILKDTYQMPARPIHPSRNPSSP